METEASKVVREDKRDKRIRLGEKVVKCEAKT